MVLFYELCEESMEAVTKHYQQAIHSDTFENEAPYFDSLLGHPLRLPPFLEHWKTKIQQHSECSYGSVFELFLHGYVSNVRSVLISVRNSNTDSTTGVTLMERGVPVLQHYELLLSSLLPNETPILSTISQVVTKRFRNSMDILASDLTRLTAAEASSSFRLKNVVIPTYLRLIEKAVIIVNIYLEHHHHEDPSTRASEDTPAGDMLLLACMRRSFIKGLAFLRPKLDPRDIIPSLTNRFQLETMIQEYGLFPPPEQELCKAASRHERPGVEDFLESKMWAKLQMDGSYWNDSQTGVAQRSAALLFQRFQSLGGGCDLTARKPETDDPTKTDHMPSYFQQLGGLSNLSRDLRAHFFGRDMHGLLDTTTSSAVTRPKTRVHLGKTVPARNSTADLDIKPYKAVPSCIHAVAQFFALLQDCRCSFDAETISNLLPICYELLDSTDPTHIALGATGLFIVLERFEEAENQSTPEWVDTALVLVERTGRTLRHGPALALLGRVHIRILGLLDNPKQKSRDLLHSWLTLVYQNSTRAEQDLIVWGLLVGGVIPLLHYFDNDISVMDLGRLGLAAIIPLLEEAEFYSKDLLFAALNTLVNFLMVAYPIMHRHGGKIMCTLVTCHLSKDASAKDDEVDFWVQHTAAVALVICGDRASAVLDGIVGEKHGCSNIESKRRAPIYDTVLVQRAVVIQTLAEKYRADESAVS